MLKEIINLFRSDDTNPWYDKIIVVGACTATDIILNDRPLEVVGKYLAGIWGMWGVAKAYEKAWEYYYMEEGLELVGDYIHPHQD